MQTNQKPTYIDTLDPDIFTYIRYGDYADRYPAHTAQEFPQEFYDEMRTASAALFRIFCKAAKVFQQAPDSFARAMDMPEELLPYLRIPNPFQLLTWLARFDFVLDEKGHIRMVEINADTPRLCTPVAALRTRALMRRTFLFSCFDDYPEDLATTRFLMRLMQEGAEHGDICFRSFYEMEIDAKGLPLADNAYASALYRLHPMEILIDERTQDGEPLGQMFLDLYREGKFAMMNPPEAIILQNKSFMALVYALAQTEQFFSAEECALIRRWLAPSYFEDDFASLADGTYIRKEIWGREGRSVSLVEKRGGRAAKVLEKQPDNADDIICRESRAAMYQDFIRQPRFVHTVDSGTTDGCLTLSCFMLFDRPSAVGARFSPEEIAGTEAYFVPLVISQK